MEENKINSAIEDAITQTVAELHELTPAKIFEGRLRKLATLNFPNAERKRAFASMVQQFHKQAAERLREFDFRTVSGLLGKLETHTHRVLMAPVLKPDRLERFRKVIQQPLNREPAGFGYHPLEVEGLERILVSEKCAEVVSADCHVVIAKKADGREVRITRRQMREATLPSSTENPDKWYAQFPSIPDDAGRGVNSNDLPKELI